MLSVTFSVETPPLLLILPCLFTRCTCDHRNEGRSFFGVDVISVSFDKVGRFREKQYQLAAQRHNEESRKCNYYQQTAKYFERVCESAQHYDSWNYKGVDPKGELEKRKKAERLLARRNQLKSLLKEEEETYRREIEDRKKVKCRPHESSLEYYREKLKQRAEQRLYYPKTCPRYQSYFVCPKESVDSRWNTLRDTNLQYPRVCRDTTNLIHLNEAKSYRRNSTMSGEESGSPKGQENRREISSRPSSTYVDEHSWPNPKFSARYSRKSLENTNVRGDDSEEYVPHKASSRSSLSAGSSAGRYPAQNDEISIHGDDKENHKKDARLSSCQEVESIISKIQQLDTKGSRSQAECLIEKEDARLTKTSSEYSFPRDRDQVDRYSVKEDQDEIDVKTKDNRQFEVEKSLPWLRMNPGDKNLSKQMFLYLTHKELKCKIEDLVKRELHACNKQYWDEALRLRDMRNKLELIREKELYNMDTLELDDETRQLGLMNITTREKELTARENICMDSTIYSEDAKALWKKWVHEDDRSVIKDARLQREKLMNTMEEEWQNLAIRDKEKITQSYQNVMENSTLLEERKLSAAINASRMKSASSSFK